MYIRNETNWGEYTGLGIYIIKILYGKIVRNKLRIKAKEDKRGKQKDIKKKKKTTSECKREMHKERRERRPH